MKLNTIYAEPTMKQCPTEYRFRKHNVRGIILKDKEQDTYTFILEHSTFEKKSSNFKSVEEAQAAAESFIDTWYTIQGRLMALR